MTEHFDVDAPGKLLSFLRTRLDSWRVNTIRERLRLGCVRVNGESATRDNHPLLTGDHVEVGDRTARDQGHRTEGSPGSRTIAILYSDDDLIAIDKPAGLLSVSTDRQKTRTALAMLRDSLAPSGRPAPLWPVHRIDRETSGVLLFARKREALDKLQSGWKDTKKIYLAIVEGHPDPAEGTIDQPLWEDRSLNVRVSRRPEAKAARTHYRTGKRGRHRALLEIEIDTGRRHQIRSHLVWLGHPVVGDRRYGNPASRMGLHALKLSICHPRDGAPLVFEAPTPRAFSALLRGSGEE